MEAETIDEYECDACKKRTQTTKKPHIWRLPKVLILTLKRFTPMGGRDNTPLVYEGQPINFGGVFAQESAEPTRSKMYGCFATVDHHGHHMGGHYTAQTLNPVWKKWHRYDDEAAIEIQKPHFGAETYMLLFR